MKVMLLKHNLVGNEKFIVYFDGFFKSYYEDGHFDGHDGDAYSYDYLHKDCTIRLYGDGLEIVPHYRKDFKAQRYFPVEFLKLEIWVQEKSFLCLKWDVIYLIFTLD